VQDGVCIEIEWKPYQIDPGTKEEGEEYLAYNRRRWGGDGWTGSLRRAGRKVGANFANWKWWPNTGKAHQLVGFAKEKGIDTSLCNQVLFEACYEEGQNLSLVDTLVELGVQKLGLSNFESELRTYLSEGSGSRRVQKEISQGRDQYRIRGVPFFVVGLQPQSADVRPYGFSGAQPPDAFLQIFQELAENID